ncbi:MAG: hypothetical protein HY908_35100 [Myxococcales bacterium]|nr:hypothetical protein [Myxococcales bacterium]
MRAAVLRFLVLCTAGTAGATCSILAGLDDYTVGTGTPDAGAGAGGTATGTGGSGGAGGSGASGGAGGLGGSGGGPVAGQHIWSAKIGALGVQSDPSLDVDDAGNVVLAARFGGTVDLGCAEQPAATTTSDLLVAKLGPGGTCAWAHGYVGEQIRAPVVAALSSGSIAVTGTFTGTMSLPPDTYGLDAGATSAAYVARWSSAGALGSSHEIGFNGATSAGGLAPAAGESLTVVGDYNSYVDLGDGPWPVGVGGTDVFLASYGPSGAFVKSAGHAADALQFTTGAARSPVDGSIFMVGSFNGTAGFGATPLVAQAADIFVASFDATSLSAATGWAVRFGTPGSEVAPTAVASDTQGNVVFVGTFVPALEIVPGDPMSATGGVDFYVAKLSPTGTPLWSKSFGGAGNDRASDVAVDGAGDIVVVGHSDGAFMVGAEQVANAGGDDAFVVKLNPGGAPRWGRSFGSSGDQRATAVAVDASRNILVAGDFTGGIDFGGTPLSASDTDLFVAKLGP